MFNHSCQSVCWWCKTRARGLSRKCILAGERASSSFRTFSSGLHLRMEFKRIHDCNVFTFINHFPSFTDHLNNSEPTNLTCMPLIRLSELGSQSILEGNTGTGRTCKLYIELHKLGLKPATCYMVTVLTTPPLCYPMEWLCIFTNAD